MSAPYLIGDPKPLKVPTMLDQNLANGLRVVAVRRSGIPRFQARLKISGGTSFDRASGNRARLLADTLLSGTKRRSSYEIALDLQTMGASLGAGIGLDRLSISGGGLVDGFDEWLTLLSEVLREPTCPKDELDISKAREMQSLAIRKSRPDSMARSQLVRRLYGRHPYGRGTPDPESVKRVNRSGVMAFHLARSRPRGSTLVVVADMPPKKIVAGVESALASWKGAPRGESPRRPEIRSQARTLLVDRPGALQTNIRIAGPAIPRTDPLIFDLNVANTIFGGYFSSRLVENIREDKGYTYSPRSALEHHQLASIFTISADVGTEVTVAALVEIRYELEKMIATRVTPEEIDSARKYLAGLTGLTLQTQSGLADYLSNLFASGLEIEYLKAYQKNLDAVAEETVAAAARRFLPPGNLTTVLVGDAERILPQLKALEEVRVIRDTDL